MFFHLKICFFVFEAYVLFFYNSVGFFFLFLLTLDIGVIFVVGFLEEDILYYSSLCLLHDKFQKRSFSPANYLEKLRVYLEKLLGNPFPATVNYELHRKPNTHGMQKVRTFGIFTLLE